MSLIDWARRGTPAPEATYRIPRQRDPLEDPNPWVRMAYYEGIDWARQERTRWGRPVGWLPPVDEWADWCESYYLTVMRGYGWAPGPEGPDTFTQQQEDVHDGIRRGLSAAWKRLYPRRHEAPQPPNLSREDRLT